VPSRVSENHSGDITTGGHKTLPYKNMRILRAFRTLYQHWKPGEGYSRQIGLLTASISPSFAVTWERR
jgi:hypothetical protein